MEEIIAIQRDSATRLTGKRFVLGVAEIVLRLALAQILCNLAITLTGEGILNVLFYLYAIATLLGYMRGTVANYCYTLKAGTLVLERLLGDSPITVVEIPLEHIITMRPVLAGEDLHLCYRQVTYIDPAAKPSSRIRWAFRLSVVSARLARSLAGAHTQAEIGSVVVYEELGRVRACVFRPNEQMHEAMCQVLGERYAMDDRMARPKLTKMRARALERAFPVLYPHVNPLVSQADQTWAEQEIRVQRERRAGKKADKAAQPAKRRGPKAKAPHSEAEPKRDTRRRRAAQKSKTLEDKDEVHDDTL